MEAEAKRDVQENNLTSSQIEQSIKSYPLFSAAAKNRRKWRKSEWEKNKNLEKRGKNNQGIDYSMVICGLFLLFKVERDQDDSYWESR
jgi:hypothetical protein